MRDLTKNDKTIADFDNKYKERTIYIVGTGPSLRLFPLEFLDDKVSIGLNQAYKIFPTTYSLTIHPDLIPFERQTWNTTWITKEKWSVKAWHKHRELGNHKYFYLFQNPPIKDVTDFSYITKPSKYKLYVGRGIHTGAMHLAARMGAKYIILVGCDFCNFEQEHHAINQHIQLHGLTQDQMYAEYYFYAVKVREILFQQYQVQCISLSPFLGLAYNNLDYNRQVDFLKLPKLSQAESLNTYVRTDHIIRDFL